MSNCREHFKNTKVIFQSHKYDINWTVYYFCHVNVDSDK